MKRLCAIIALLIVGCQSEDFSLKEAMTTTTSLKGKKEYQHTPYITAGNRFYAIGAQDGSFPEIGWHINGEMGGLWNHPIKVADGFQLHLNTQEDSITLKDGSFNNFPLGNQIVYENQLGLEVTQTQFVPDGVQGMLVEYTFLNLHKTSFDGGVQFQTDFDLRPTWLSERQEISDGQDEHYTDEGTNDDVFVAKDNENNWFAAVSSIPQAEKTSTQPSKYQGKGLSEIFQYSLRLEPHEKQKISFFISSSVQSSDEAIDELYRIKNDKQALFEQKAERVKKLEYFSQLNTSDENFNEVYKWIKYNSEWFIREVPEIGRGIAAGYPDYPWWFGCDSEYALQGYLATGNFDITRSSIALLASLSNQTNSNGRIVHEASTNGVVFNPGNINETPQFVSLLWQTYLWTGDRSILEEHYELLQKGMTWLLGEKDTNANGFPEGSGMMEIHGLDSEMIDVAAYSQKALEDAAKIAAVLEYDEQARSYEQKAAELKVKINEKFWVDDFNSYGDFIANDSETLQLIEDAMVRADTLGKPWAVEELKQTKGYLLKNPSKKERPFVLHHNWVVNTPLEVGIAPEDKAQKALETARKFVNPFGAFVTGIDRDETAGQDFGSFKGSKIFSYTGAVMTLPTGVAAVAENNYGNPDWALDYLTRMGRSFSFALPGSIYEVSPDYGMFAQAWNIYSYAVPVVRQFFGISPEAAEQSVLIKPLMPSTWDFAELKNVRVGSNEISLFYKKSTDGYSIKVASKESNWNIEVQPQKGYELLEIQQLESQKMLYTYQKSSALNE